MAQILLIHEDGLLRERYRELLELEGHTVSEISTSEDLASLPRQMIIDRILTTLDPLPEDILMNIQITSARR